MVPGFQGFFSKNWHFPFRSLWVAMDLVR